MSDPICYIEIAVQDLEAARKFYEVAFGWTTKVSGENYASFSAGDGLSGGLHVLRDRLFDGPVLLYVKVDDIPEALDRVVKAGGTTERTKTSIGEYGFMGTFRDPSGNRLGLWSKT